jgi:hypothetical protein
MNLPTQNKVSVITAQSYNFYILHCWPSLSGYNPRVIGQPTLRHLNVEFCISVDGSFVHELKGVRSHTRCVRACMRVSRKQGVYYLLCFQMRFTSIQLLLITAESPQTPVTEFFVFMSEILQRFHLTVNKMRYQQSNPQQLAPLRHHTPSLVYRLQADTQSCVSYTFLIAT